MRRGTSGSPTSHLIAGLDHPVDAGRCPVGCFEAVAYWAHATGREREQRLPPGTIEVTDGSTSTTAARDVALLIAGLAARPR